MTRVVLIVAVLSAPSAARAEWRKLASLPDKEGFAGSFAGVSGGALLVGGGANFPDKKPWDGGKKVWYDTVFVLETPASEWKVAGKLPRALGYGVSVTHKGAVVCAGGSDAEGHYADCFKLEWTGGKLVTTNLPALPKPVANGCGALVGDALYVAGGQEKPDSPEAITAVFTLDLSNPNAKWREEDPIPGKDRILAVGASFDGKFWIAGGAELITGKDKKTERKYLTDAYFHEPTKGWGRCAPLPSPVVGAPGPAPADTTGFYVLGGDDGSQLTAAPDKHKGFSNKILRFDTKKGEWVAAGELPAPRVTAPIVEWAGAWVLVSGERRPGVRSPEVWRFEPKK